MRAAAKNRKKITKTSYFDNSKWIKVTDVNTPRKACRQCLLW